MVPKSCLDLLCNQIQEYNALALEKIKRLHYAGFTDLELVEGLMGFYDLAAPKMYSTLNLMSEAQKIRHLHVVLNSAYLQTFVSVEDVGEVVPWRVKAYVDKHL